MWGSDKNTILWANVSTDASTKAIPGDGAVTHSNAGTDGGTYRKTAKEGGGSRTRTHGTLWYNGFKSAAYETDIYRGLKEAETRSIGKYSHEPCNRPTHVVSPAHNHEMSPSPDDNIGVHISDRQHAVGVTVYMDYLSHRLASGPPKQSVGRP